MKRPEKAIRVRISHVIAASTEVSKALLLWRSFCVCVAQPQFSGSAIGALPRQMKGGRGNGRWAALAMLLMFVYISERGEVFMFRRVSSLFCRGVLPRTELVNPGLLSKSHMKSKRRYMR